MTINARSLTDNARLYATLALGEARGVAIIVLCETKRRAEIGPIPEWAGEFTKPLPTTKANGDAQSLYTSRCLKHLSEQRSSYHTAL